MPILLLQHQHQHQHQHQLLIQRNKPYINNSTQSPLLHFQQNNTVDVVLHHKCNHLRITDTVHHHHKTMASALLR